VQKGGIDDKLGRFWADNCCMRSAKTGAPGIRAYGKKSENGTSLILCADGRTDTQKQDKKDCLL